MEETGGNVLIDLSKQGLKQLQRTWNEADNIESLILNENNLCNLENVGDLPSLQLLSAAKNRIRRMTSIPNLSNLCSLDLSNNTIVCIEGLKGLTSLKHLNLSGNYIKIIDHLNTNLQLEYLDLSDNAIGHINDVSHLTNLKELYLNKNHISHLRHCEKYLPENLELFTLHDNSIADLAEISYLEKSTSLKHLTLKNNPCLETGSGKTGFNYRPYIKMWCLNISIVDGTPLDPIESLKAEWLYSQGRGRRFRPGEQEALVNFLAGACPLSAKSIGAEEDRKLLLILSKAEQYKQQLRDHPPDYSYRYRLWDQCTPYSTMLKEGSVFTLEFRRKITDFLHLWQILNNVEINGPLLHKIKFNANIGKTRGGIYFMLTHFDSLLF